MVKLGIEYDRLGELPVVTNYYDMRLHIACERGDIKGQAGALNNLGAARDELGDTAAAIALHEQSLALHRRILDRYGEAHA